jgi:hypothetical protein
MDVRCEHKKHGEIIEGVLEVRCRSVMCGHSAATVVIHRWDILNGERLNDKRFAVPVATARPTKERAKL